MKKNSMLMLFFLAVLLTACQSNEDTQEISGSLLSENVLGYEYVVNFGQSPNAWQIGYEGDITIIEENSHNEKELQQFMEVVNDSNTFLAKLIVWASCFIIVVVTSFIFYKKYGKSRKDVDVKVSSLAIIAAMVISAFLVVDAALLLNQSLQEAEFHYVKLKDGQ
ncbi:hypothetical protein [Aureibacillus halotolerans]|uniref:Uncharacterized protein n=1 Tax=Aureibacillus halotolerans TaxID=1508390 RepID=A0A4R6TYU5_9BACI|nr:hypothetical protein [Aureibacillus halotolerans]TDQ38781.1 hypothetical protein EV213_109150 [Aureibacillus halotolerans]